MATHHSSLQFDKFTFGPVMHILWEHASLLYNCVFNTMIQFLSNGDWERALSAAIRDLLVVFALPIEILGNFLEDLMSCFGDYKDAQERSHKLTVIGHLDKRVTLPTGTQQWFPTSSATSRPNADVCVMAAKLAYENRAVVEDVVNNRWNKDLAEDDARFEYVVYLKQVPAREGRPSWSLMHSQRHDKTGTGLADTNVHIFVRHHKKDKDKDDKDDTEILGPTAAVVVAFRGTEPFSPRDWSTDFDFSAVDLGTIGRVHKGFLEALGIGPSQMDDFCRYIAAAVEEEEDEPPLPQPSQQQTGRKRAELQRKLIVWRDGPGERAGILDEEATPLYFVLRERVLGLIMGRARTQADAMEGGAQVPVNKDVKLFVTGHSLGGALAALFTSLLIVDSAIARNRLKALYTFGQPRVGDLSFSWQLANRVNRRELRFIRLLHCNDIVPRVPFDNDLFQYKHVGPWFQSSPVNRIQMGGFNDQPALGLWPPALLVASVRQLWVAVFRWWSTNPDFAESNLSLLSRFVAFVCPWLVDHSPVNYVNAVRFGLPEQLGHKAG